MHKKTLLFILLASISASAQLQRYDSFAATTASPSGVGNITQVIPNATLSVFNYPGVGISCAGGGCTAANTYTSRSGTTPCGAGVPLTRPTANTCLASTDAQGNFGFWAFAGGYQYCIAAPTFTTQCYNILLGAGGSTTDAEVWVSPIGNDANEGLNAGSAKATLAGAKAACPVSGSCRIHVTQGGITVGASITFTQGTLIQCDPRANLVYSSNSNQITFSGSGSGVFGCGFTGQGSGTPGNPPIVASANFFIFSYNSISLFGSTGTKGELSITAGQNLSVLNNIFNQNGDYDVAVLNATSAQVMFSIVVNSNILSDLLVSLSGGGGASIAALNINNNGFSEGEASKTNPCLKLVSTTINITDVTIAGNNCVPSTSGPTIGYALTGVTGLTFVGNVWDASGISAPANGLNFSNINNATIGSNTLANSGSGSGMLLERLNNSTVSNNSVSGLAASGSGYVLTVTTTSGTSTSNTLSNNIAVLPNAGTGIGFSLVCNATSAVCSNNTLSGNSVFNGTTGISVTNTTGTTANTFIGSNLLETLTNGILIGAGVSTTDILQQKNVSVTTAVNDSGTTTLLHGTIASGTAAMTTAPITAGNCGTTVTVAATGALTTDTITWAFNAAPAGSNAGIVAWPTANNVNFAYCSNTAQTPAAATINWRVMR